MKRLFFGELIIIILLLFLQNNVLHKKTIIENDLYISADGRGYYEYLPAFFIYNDLHFEYLDTVETDMYSNDYKDHIFPVNTETGYRMDKYFVGTALLQAPFFAVTHFFTSSDDSKHPPNGYSEPYQKAILYAAIFYLFIGLIFIHLLLKTYPIKSIWIHIIQLSLVFATPLLNYTIYEPAYSHIYSFFLISCFLYILRKYFTSFKPSYLIIAIAVFGLIAIVRPINILIVLFTPLLTESLVDFFRLVRNMIIKHYKQLIIGCVLAGLITSIQCFISYVQTGHPFNYSYGNEGFDFTEPHIFLFLFSYQKGFFLWTPWWLIFFTISIISSISQRKKFLIVYSSFSFLVLVYVFSSWHIWTYGASIGSRPMIDFYPAFILFNIPFLTSKEKLLKFTILPLSILCMLFMQIQTYQYQVAIIHWDAMNKKSYWDVFLKTNKKYTWYLWKQEYKVGDKLSEQNLIKENLDIPGKSHAFYSSEKIDLLKLDSLAKHGELFVSLNREPDNEFLQVDFLNQYDSILDSYTYINLFHYNENTTTSRFRFPLTANSQNYAKIQFSFLDLKDNVSIKRIQFNTYTDKIIEE